MPDYDVLKSLLSKPEYAGLSDQEVADLYNSKTVVVSQPSVPLAQVQIWGAKNHARKAIEDHCSDADPIGSVCLTVRDFLQAGSTLDLGDPDNLAMIAGLVQAGVLTADQQTLLLSLKDQVVPLYSQPDQFGVPISQFDVAHARTL